MIKKRPPRSFVTGFSVVLLLAQLALRRIQSRSRPKGTSALLNRPLKRGLAVIGGLNLGGSIEIVPDPLDLVELAIEKGPLRCYCRSPVTVPLLLSLMKPRPGVTIPRQSRGPSGCEPLKAADWGR